MRQGLLYNEACQKAGYNHSELEYQSYDKLPYYGEILKNSCLGQKKNYKSIEERYGRISNVTVHVALNQIRYLVNALIRKYGKPHAISIEYARDLPASAKERQKISNSTGEHEKANQKIKEDIKKKIQSITPSDKDIEKYKIWENQHKQCPYTGQTISIEQLFNGETEVDHILPFSRIYDDSINNKIVCFTSANRDKRNCTPYEAFGPESNSAYSWEDILKHTKKLNAEQRWRFTKDAMQRFKDRESPIARSLNDTRYMTKILQQYLRPIMHEDGEQFIQSVRGKLTALIRNAWGLNEYKEKEDKDNYLAFHNHHAIDAIIVSMISRKQIQEASNRLKQDREKIHKQIEYIFKDELWKIKHGSTCSYEEQQDLKKRIRKYSAKEEVSIIKEYIKIPNIKTKNILDMVKNINISHKPSFKNIYDKNSTVGELHEDTAYGLLEVSDNKL